MDWRNHNGIEQDMICDNNHLQHHMESIDFASNNSTSPYTSRFTQQHTTTSIPFALKPEGYVSSGTVAALAEFGSSNMSDSSQNVDENILRAFNNSTLSDTTADTALKLLGPTNSSSMMPSVPNYATGIPMGIFPKNSAEFTNSRPDVGTTQAMLQNFNLNYSNQYQQNALAHAMQRNLANTMKRKSFEPPIKEEQDDMLIDKKPCLRQGPSSMVQKGYPVGFQSLLNAPNLPQSPHLQDPNDFSISILGRDSSGFGGWNANMPSVTLSNTYSGLSQSGLRTGNSDVIIPTANSSAAAMLLTSSNATFAKTLNKHCTELSMDEVIAAMQCIAQGADMPGDSKIQKLKSIVCDNSEGRPDRFHKKKSSDIVSKSIAALKNKAASITSSGSGQGCTIVVITQKPAKIGKGANPNTPMQDVRDPITRSNFGKWINTFMKSQGLTPSQDTK